jgi:hypothetical protein
LHIAEDSLEFLEDSKSKLISTISSCLFQLNLEPKLKKIEQKGEEVAAEDVEKTFTE